MPTNPLYQNQLDEMLTNPNAFQGTPGFKFALDQGTNAINANNSAMRGSGNVLSELMKYGTGLASQNYGNQRDFLGKMVGQEQQYGLGQEQNANTAQNNAWNYDLGKTSNANTAQRDKWNYQLDRNKLNQNNWNLWEQGKGTQNLVGESPWMRWNNYS